MLQNWYFYMHWVGLWHSNWPINYKDAKQKAIFVSGNLILLFGKRFELKIYLECVFRRLQFWQRGRVVEQAKMWKMWNVEIVSIWFEERRKALVLNEKLIIFESFRFELKLKLDLRLVDQHELGKVVVQLPSSQYIEFGQLGRAKF